MEAFVPVGILIILGIIVCGAIYGITSLLGPRIFQKNKLSPYECGVQGSVQASARLPFQIKFYLIAVIFLLFDVEAAFFLPWALVYRESLATGPTLLVAMGLYLFFMVLALWYILRKGALKFN